MFAFYKYVSDQLVSWLIKLEINQTKFLSMPFDSEKNRTEVVIHISFIIQFLVNVLSSHHILGFVEGTLV